MIDFPAGKPGALRHRFLPACSVLLLLLLVQPADRAEWFKQQVDIMGTRITVELWNDDPAAAGNCSAQVIA